MTSQLQPSLHGVSASENSLEHLVQALLYARRAADLDQAAPTVRELTTRLLDGMRSGDLDARRELHSALYRINTAAISCPWQHDGFNVGHPLFSWLRDAIESAWLDDERDRAVPEVADVPLDPEGFASFVTDVIQRHRSGVGHPLFRFLQRDATRAQLREFHLQESPLDVIFADLLCLIMAGLPGPLRQEVAANFWDEMGRGSLQFAHRTLRERMTESLGLSTSAHLDTVELFGWEELALANLYYRATLDRQRLCEGIGILLATEMAVPGRIECQLEGCLRVGMKQADLRYLEEHVTVDVAHADGWLRAVVLPIVRARPEAATDVMLGVWRRLELAAAVCDRMYGDLPSVMD